MPTIKVSSNCPRCRRPTGEVVVNSFEEAQQVTEPGAVTASGLERLKALVQELKDEGTLPAAFAYVVTPEGVHIESQPALCNDPDAKRSCVKTLDNLLPHFQTKPERAPRGTKKKAEETPAEGETTATEQ